MTVYNIDPSTTTVHLSDSDYRKKHGVLLKSIVHHVWRDDAPPLVSIKCITYNQEAYISDAIEGFLKQETTFPVEIIIHDDASTDKTAEIIREYASRFPSLIRPYYQSENQYSKGIGLIRTVLSDMCTGKYIALCEGDDYWTDSLKLQKQVEFMESNTDTVLCFHKVKILELDGSLVDDYITKVPNHYQSIEALATYGNYIHTPSVLHRNILKTYPEQLNKSPLGDFFVYMLLAQNGKLGMIDQTMSVYRNNVGIWSTQSEENRIIKTLLVLILMMQAFRDSRPDISDLLVRRIDDYFDAIIPRITGVELQFLRSNTSVSIYLDQLIISKLQYNVAKDYKKATFHALLIELIRRLQLLISRRMKKWLPKYR